MKNARQTRAAPKCKTWVQNLGTGSCEEIRRKDSFGLLRNICESVDAGVTNDSNVRVPRMVYIHCRQMVLRSVDVERLIDEDHSARSVWELVGRLDLSLYHARIAAIERPRRTWAYRPAFIDQCVAVPYSRGISSAREVARQCEFEPGLQWLCGLAAISHRTLSGFRYENKTACDDLFVQGLGMLSAEGLITLERHILVEVG